MTAVADWGQWLVPWRTGDCRPCGTCDMGLHDKCAWKPGGAHEGGWNTHVAYVMVGTGPEARYAGKSLRSWRLYDVSGRKWHCTCGCRTGGYIPPKDVPNGELALW